MEGLDWLHWDTSPGGLTVYDRDHLVPRPSGVLDQHGRELHHKPERIGFVLGRALDQSKDT